MGLFSSVGHAVSHAGKQVAGTVQKAGKQASQNVLNASLYPVQLTAKQVGGALKAAAPVLKQATGIIRSNPELLQAASSLIPGMGGLFGSSAGAAPVNTDTAGYSPEPSGGIPTWVWIAGAGAVVGLYLMMRKS